MAASAVCTAGRFSRCSLSDAAEATINNTKINHYTSGCGKMTRASTEPGAGYSKTCGERYLDTKPGYQFQDKKTLAGDVRGLCGVCVILVLFMCYPGLIHVLTMSYSCVLHW